MTDAASRYNSLAGFFKIFSEPARLLILDAINSQGSLNVTQVVEATGLSQSLASKHLRLLSAGGILTRRQEGSLAIYSIAGNPLANFLESVKRVARVAKRNQYEAFVSQD